VHSRLHLRACCAASTAALWQWAAIPAPGGSAHADERRVPSDCGAPADHDTFLHTRDARAQGASLGGECVFKLTVSVKWGEISRGEISNSTPRLNVALARLVDLKAALLAETRARGPDRSRMRSPQLAR